MNLSAMFALLIALAGGVGCIAESVLRPLCLPWMAGKGGVAVWLRCYAMLLTSEHGLDTISAHWTSLDAAKDARCMLAICPRLRLRLAMLASRAPARYVRAGSSVALMTVGVNASRSCPSAL